MVFTVLSPVWVRGSWCVWLELCSGRPGSWSWMKLRPPSTWRQTIWSSPPSGPSLRTAPSSPSHTGSTPSWTTQGQIFVFFGAADHLLSKDQWQVRGLHKALTQLTVNHEHQPIGTRVKLTWHVDFKPVVLDSGWCVVLQGSGVGQRSGGRVRHPHTPHISERNLLRHG